MMTSSEIRQQFLDFFASKGHAIVPSAPIVIKNDPTLHIQELRIPKNAYALVESTMT
jgi:alanyl-tRNA synthetase